VQDFFHQPYLSIQPPPKLRTENTSNRISSFKIKELDGFGARFFYAKPFRRLTPQALAELSFQERLTVAHGTATASAGKTHSPHSVRGQLGIYFWL